MESIRLFKDLVTEIDNLKVLKNELIQQKKRLRIELQEPREIKAYDITKNISAPRPPRELAIVLSEFMEVDRRLKYVCDMLKYRKKAREKVEKNLKKLEGIDYQVVYLRDIENWKLGEIAMELNFSEDWIKKISARNPRI